MKPHRKKRLTVILFIAASLAVAIGLTLYALGQNLNMFFTPTQVAAGETPSGARIRVGGMVKDGSVVFVEDSPEVRFVATDYANDVPIQFAGRLPDLFREGQGIVVEGEVDSAGVLQASRVLAKHDENYMSVEVKEALDAANVAPPRFDGDIEGVPNDP